MKTLYPGNSDYEVYLAKLALSRALSYESDFSDMYTSDFETKVREFQKSKKLKSQPYQYFLILIHG